MLNADVTSPMSVTNNYLRGLVDDPHVAGGLVNDPCNLYLRGLVNDPRVAGGLVDDPRIILSCGLVDDPRHTFLVKNPQESFQDLLLSLDSFRYNYLLFIRCGIG